VVVTHNPPWASPSDYGTPNIINEATNMRWDWYALGVDLILAGHFHCYERLLKNTGSGNVPIIICGTSGTGATDLGRTSVDPGSLAFFNDVIDAHFGAGHLIMMTITANSLTIDLSGIDDAYAVHTGKDQLILT
jgi:hypothetical protein